MAKIEMDSEDLNTLIEENISKALKNNSDDSSKDPKIKISEFLDHQSKCSSGDCPLCKTMNERVLAEKAGQIINKIDKITGEKKK